MKEFYNSIQELVPHRPPLLLIQNILEADDQGLRACVNTADSGIFSAQDGKIPSYVGIEYMAQAISAWAGLAAKREGRPIQLGFLLGTRRYHSQVAYFEANTQLQVRVREMLRDETNLVLFDCQVLAGEQVLATAQIKAIQPDNLDALLEQSAEYI